MTLKQIASSVWPILMGAIIALNGDSTLAQGGATVQLPVIGFRSVRTAVSVPDGGTINLSGGGGSRYTQSQWSSLGRLPKNNRYRNGAGATSGTSLSAKIVRLKDFERQMMEDHAAGRSQPGDVRINGSLAVQAKADLISRNVGR
jgi:hypothetical protein